MESEYAAREVLNLFVERYKCKPGHILFLFNIRLVWLDRGHRYADLIVGIECAEKKGWIRYCNDSKQTFTLTEVGVQEYRISSE